MNRDRVVVHCALALMMAVCGPLGAQETPSGQSPSTSTANFDIRLRNHEPIFLGYTQDSDDEAFMDFTISLQYPLFADLLSDGANRFRVLPYFAATVRMGQYIGTRESSPVILKRFNPKLFLRYTSQHFPKDGKSPDRYIDLEYAHESNGQSVDDAATFQAIAAAGGTEHAKDYISRGWDYIGITAKRDIDKQNNWHIYVNRKWYCGCLMQKNVEEIFSFEDPREITSIRQVSGWKAMVTYKNPSTIVDRAALIFDTGTRDTFQYNTARIEFGLGYFSKKFFGVPIVAWYQNGYLSDLAQYYKKVHSYGLAFRFETRSEKL